MFRSKVTWGNFNRQSAISGLNIPNLLELGSHFSPVETWSIGRTWKNHCPCAPLTPVTHVLNMRIVPPNVKRQYSNSLFSRD
jgi:hypothetical protein